MGTWSPSPGGVSFGPPRVSGSGLYVPSYGALGQYITRGASAPVVDPVTASGATSWYDAHDGSGLQEVPSRIGLGVMTLGSTNGVNTNDPTYTTGPPAYWINDGVDDYLQLPTTDKPTLTSGTTSALTVMVVAMRTGATSGNYFSSNANTSGVKMLANNNGCQLFMGGSGSTPVTTVVTDTINTIGAYAFSFDGAGTASVFAYYHNGTSSTVSATVSTSGNTSCTHASAPRSLSLAASVSGAAGIRRVYSITIWNGLAKTQGDLDTVAAYLIAAHV